jgi:hypothetical protein
MHYYIKDIPIKWIVMKDTKNANNNGEQENIIYNFIRNLMRMQALNAYFICFLWSSKDWMGTLYASTEVLRIERLLYMPHRLEFHGLNGYCISIL